jgi:hypothetical protein
MTNPNDPWSKRPEPGAADQVRAAYGDQSDVPAEEHPGASRYQPGETASANYATDDPTQAYGAPAGPNPTLHIPAYETLRDQQRTSAGRPPLPPNMPPPIPARRSPALLVGAGLGVGLLVAAALGAVYLVLGHRSDDSSDAAPAQSTPPSVVAPSQAPALPAPGFDTHILGGLGHALGNTTTGSITANDGATLTVQGALGGALDTVHTDDGTQVVSISGSKVSDLKVGDMVIVQGDRRPDGSIDAKLIISTALGN